MAEVFDFLLSTKAIGAGRGLSLAPIDRAWDGAKAATNLRKWASSDGSGTKEKMNWGKYKSGFAYYDANDKENFGSYKLPIADVIDGSPKVVFAALSAVVVVLNGGRGGVNIPSGDKQKIYNTVSFYYKKFDKEVPPLKKDGDMSFDEEIENNYIEYKDAGFFTPYNIGNKTYMDFPFELKQEDVKEDGSFKGYAATFLGKPDRKGDIIMPGAFARTLKRGGGMGLGFSFLKNHDPDTVIGVMNTLFEDRKGLYVEGQFAINTSAGHDEHELAKMKAKKAFSIGYNAIDYDYNNNRSIRYLKEIELFEVSFVTFPANTRAKMLAVKSLEGAETEREMERALRDLGLSKKASVYVASLCKNSLRDSGKIEGKGLSNILGSLKQLNNSFIMTKYF